MNSSSGERRRVLAVDNVNLSIEEGQFVCFVGPSGCGKSTLLNIIAGLDKPSEGEMVLNGQSVLELAPIALWSFKKMPYSPG